MEIMVAMIVIPTLALGMMYANSQRRYGLDRPARDFARTLLKISSFILVGHAVLFLIWMITGIASNLGQNLAPSTTIIAISLRLILIGFLLFAARFAYLVSNHYESKDLSLYESAQRERESQSFGVSLIVLIGLPLLVPGTFVLILIAGFFIVEYVMFSLARSAAQNRLLWTLALAARQDLPMQIELDAFALCEGRKQREKVARIAHSLRDGNSLSQSLRTVPRSLPFEMIAAIQVAEESDTLRETLPALAMEHTRQLRMLYVDNTVANVSIYVTLVASMFLSVSGFIMYWIMPKYKAIFNDFDIDLPQFTQSFISVLDHLSTYWILILPLLSLPTLILSGLVFFSLGVHQAPRFLQMLFPRLVSPQILSALSSATTQFKTLPATLTVLADASSHEVWSERLRRIGARIEKGDDLPHSVYAERFITQTEAKALKHAETAGHLSWGLQAISDRIHISRVRRFLMLGEFAKPCAILLLGAAVLAFALAMFLPLVHVLESLAVPI